MAPTALVTIQLEGWPPPTIEIHALAAALPHDRSETGGRPPSAIQHLNELVLAFPTSESDTTVGDARVRQVARRALASIHDGAFHVTQARVTP